MLTLPASDHPSRPMDLHSTESRNLEEAAIFKRAAGNLSVVQACPFSLRVGKISVRGASLAASLVEPRAVDPRRREKVANSSRNVRTATVPKHSAMIPSTIHSMRAAGLSDAGLLGMARGPLGSG